MMAGLSLLFSSMVLMATEPSIPPKVDPKIINIRELQIDVALGRARARALSKARRDAFGRLLLIRRNLRSRALRELSVDAHRFRD